MEQGPHTPWEVTPPPLATGASAAPDETVPVPYAFIPEGATPDQIIGHHLNYVVAIAACANMDNLGPVERLMRNELRSYLALHFDPRPLSDIDEEVRADIRAQGQHG